MRDREGEEGSNTKKRNTRKKDEERRRDNNEEKNGSLGDGVRSPLNTKTFHLKPRRGQMLFSGAKRNRRLKPFGGSHRERDHLHTLTRVCLKTPFPSDRPRDVLRRGLPILPSSGGSVLDSLL